MSGILRLESLTKGNTLKQGDKTPLKYRLFDADDEKLNIAGKSAKVRLVYPDFLTIGYEKDGLTVAQDDTVTFTIDNIIPSRIYHVEIIVDEQFIFPSRADEAKFTVDKSSLGTESNIVEIVGVDAVVRKTVDLINEDPNLIIDEDKLVSDIISNTGIGSIEEYYQQFNNVITDLSEEKDYHSLPEISAARGGHDTLGDRLDETTAQLAQTKREAFRKRELEDLSQNVLSAIEGGEGTSFNLLSEPQLHSVTTDKTTFAKQGKNLFTGKLHGIGLAGSYNDVISETEGNLSAIVPVKPNTKYTVTTFGENTIKRLGAYSEYPNSGKANTRSNRGSTEMESLGITTGSNDYYLVAHVSMDNTAPSQLQIEEGEKTTYETPNTNIRIDLSDDSIPTITPDMTDFLKANTSNLWDGEYHQLIMGGAPLRVTTPTQPSQSIIIKVDPEETYSINLGSPTERFRITELIKYPEIGDAYITTETKHGDITYEITTDENTQYLFIQVSLNLSDLPEYITVVRKGDKTQPFEIDDSIVGFDRGDSTTPSDIALPYIITDNVAGNYKPVSTRVFTLNTEDDVSLVYGFYDALMAEYPDYITRTLLMNEPGENLPIYRYDFKPPTPSGIGGFTGNPIKMLAVNNIHGIENTASIHLLSFIEDLANNWESDDTLRMLRWNIHLIVIPIFNPYGFKNKVRGNSNGVDLNRNFPINWYPAFEPGNAYYAGESPLSEPENIMMDEFLENNKDITFAVDFHNSNNYNMTGYVVSTKTASDKVMPLLVGVSNQMTSYSKINYPEIVGTDNNDTMHIIGERSDHGRFYQFINSKGIPSLIYETSTNDSGMPSDSLVDMSQAFIGNLYLNAVRYINQINS